MGPTGACLSDESDPRACRNWTLRGEPSTNSYRSAQGHRHESVCALDGGGVGRACCWFIKLQARGQGGWVEAGGGGGGGCVIKEVASVTWTVLEFSLDLNRTGRCSRFIAVDGCRTDSGGGGGAGVWLVHLIASTWVGSRRMGHRSTEAGVGEHPFRDVGVSGGTLLGIPRRHKTNAQNGWPMGPQEWPPILGL